MRKSTSFRLGIQSVAILVSGKSLHLQGFFFSGNESNEEIEENRKQERELPEAKRRFVGIRFLFRFPVQRNV